MGVGDLAAAFGSQPGIKRSSVHTEITADFGDVSITFLNNGFHGRIDVSYSLRPKTTNVFLVCPSHVRHAADRLQWADGIRVDTSGKHVVLLILSEDEKGGQDRTFAITPDFEELLLSVPREQREGFVFNPELHRGVSRRLDTVSKAIVRLGKKAKVKVDQKKEKTIWASAHDLRRAFGEWWARRVMPMVLKEFMRHESVRTTEKYYVGINAQSTAAFLHSLKGDTSGDTHEKTDSAETESVRKNH